jgi:hypothetical protein
VTAPSLQLSLSALAALLELPSTCTLADHATLCKCLVDCLSPPNHECYSAVGQPCCTLRIGKGCCLCFNVGAAMNLHLPKGAFRVVQVMGLGSTSSNEMHLPGMERPCTACAAPGREGS